METQHNIIQHFLKAANAFPAKSALIEGNTVITYQQLLEQVLARAQHFLKAGIKPNDRVLVFVPMSIDLYINVLALFYIGAAAVFLDEWVNKKRLELCCQIAQCKAFIAPLKLQILAYLSKEIRKIPIWLKPKHKLVQPHSPIPVFAAGKENTALITFTTGSTGTPKAANRTHGFLHEQFRALLHEIKPNEQDVGLPVLPVVLLMNLGVGCTSIISSFRSAKPEKTNFNEIATSINLHKITRIECSPDFIIRLSDHLIQNKISTPCLQKIFTGGAPVFPLQANRILRAFPFAELHVVYGSTESEPISRITGKELVSDSNKNIHKGLPVGTIYDKASVLILPIQNNPIVCQTKAELVSMSLSANHVGEIIVSGHHVLRHYINNPAAEALHKIIVEGICWHRTGDSGFLDEKGQLYLCGRANQVLSKNDSLILPFLIENQLQESGLTTRGTILEKNHLLYLFAEGTPELQAKLVTWAAEKKLPVDRVVVMKKLPRDKRHYSKIEYGKLLEFIH